jgi:hypothetical protein
MRPKLIEASYAGGFSVRCRFSDGTEGDVDLSSELGEGIFGALRDVEYFRQLVLNRDIHTITWPNGADFAPEFLYDRLKHSA